MGITNSCFYHLKEVEKEGSGECSGGGVEEQVECSGGGVEEEIECSKSHWSILDVVEDDEVAEVSNVEEFLALQRHPSWGGFFQIFGNDFRGRYESMGELMVGEKFAEGAQAELYDCKVKWWYSKGNDGGVRRGKEYVLKVFKKGTYLKHLKSLMPQGLLQCHVEDMKNIESSTRRPVPKFFCHVLGGTLLRDGRFAFLMRKEHFDLRHLIDENMKLRSGKDCGPFSMKDVELIMFRVALGVECLHRQDIVHRDLKASNVLVKRKFNRLGEPRWVCVVADYECSGGVLGTGFFRAPEILQACKERKLEERPEVFSKAADIYGYGMICYEVLTGKLPFEGRLGNDYDHVLSGHRPLVPKHVEGWMDGLLDKCWQSDPTARPCIGDILSVILANSEAAIRVDERFKKEFGQNYREGLHARMPNS